MSKVITFSTKFPSYHPKAGKPTYFVEKIYAGLADSIPDFKIPKEFKDYDWFEYYNCGRAKSHTIRAGNRWKAGEKFSPRIWSGKPYHSKQITFASDIEIRKVWNIGLRIRGDYKEFYCNDEDLTGSSIITLSMNDGFKQVADFLNWFPKPFEGQIICWNEKIKY